MYKKIISILLCLCMLSGYVTIASAMTPSNADKYEIVEIFKTLDMLSEDYDSVTIEWQKTMTKAEFAYLAANVLKRDFDGSNELYFHDVSKQHWASSDISTLVESGLLEVDSTKRFNPNDNITMDEAVKVMLKALGYGFIFNGNQYINPASVARDCGITDGISNSENLTFTDAIKMLYNTLIAEVAGISGLANNSAVFSGSGKTYLEKEYSILYKKGVVEGFECTSQTGAILDEGMAVISGAEYKAGNVDLSDFMGYSVFYMYLCEDDEEPGTLLWVKKGTVEEITLYYWENEVSFDSSSYKLSYHENNSRRLKKAEISRTADVIYNNEYVSSGIEELLSKDMYYSVKLIKNPEDKAYSKVILSDYENMMVEAIDVNNQMIFDKIAKKSIELENFDFVKIIKDNQRVNISELKIGDILSVYISKTGKSITISASSSVITGTIRKTHIESDCEIITINDTEYRWHMPNMSIGGLGSLPVSIYLDANGQIAFAEKYIAQGNLAYMVDVKLSSDEEYLMIEMLKSDGKFTTINTAKTLRIDNAKFKDAGAAYGTLGEKEFKPSLVLYKVDADGLVSHIYFPGEGKNAELKIIQKKTSGQYTSAIGRLGRKSIVGDKTIIFSIPKNPKTADIDQFEVLSKSGLRNNTTYTYSTYSLANEVSYEEIMVIDAVISVSSDLGILVTKKYVGLNEYEEVVDIIEGYVGANLVTLKCDPSCSAKDIEEGMYVLYGVNNSGNVASMEIKCKYKQDGSRPVSTNINAATTAYTSGFANKIVGEFVRVGDESGANFDTVYNFTSSIPVLVYKKNGDVEVGSIASVKAYETVGDKCSFIFTHIRGGGSKVYIIYE